MRHNQAQPVKEILAAVMGQLEKRRDTPLTKIIDNWTDIVPKKAAKHARPSALKNRVLFISVDSSAWVYELTLEYKELLLTNARKVAGNDAVQEVRFGVGKV